MFWRVLWRLMQASRGPLVLALIAVASGAAVTYCWTSAVSRTTDVCWTTCVTLTSCVWTDTSAVGWNGAEQAARAIVPASRTTAMRLAFMAAFSP